MSSNLKPYFIAVILILGPQYGVGQDKTSALWLAPSVKAHPPGFAVAWDGFSDESYDNLPVFQFDLGWSWGAPASSGWSMDVALSYRHTKQRFNFKGLSGSPGSIDPIVPKEGSYLVDNLNFGGVKFGGSYAQRLGPGQDFFLIPFGAQLHLPFASTSYFQSGNTEGERSGIYRKGAFKYGVFYGLYFRPTYQFKLTKSRRSPWHFGIYAEGDLLILNQSQSNPKWTAGVGLEVRYILGK